MRICIYGAGAIGGHLAARLADGGHAVSVVARGANLQAIRAHGLTLRRGEETIQAAVAASDDPAALGPQDLVISTLKANALASLAAGIGPLLEAGTRVVFAQNGIPWWYAQGLPAAAPRPPDLGRLDPGGALARAVSPERVLGAVINSSNEVIEPGVVANTSPVRNAVLVGAPDDGESAELAALREALIAVGIASSPVPSIRQAIWRKLMVNMTLSILCLLTGHKATVVGQDDRIGGLFVRAAREAVAIAAAHGVPLDDFDPEAVRPNAPDHKPSVLQDYERGRPLELDALLLTPLDFARTAGLETPSLDALAALAVRKGMDKGVFGG